MYVTIESRARETASFRLRRPSQLYGNVKCVRFVSHAGIGPSVEMDLDDGSGLVCGITGNVRVVHSGGTELFCLSVDDLTNEAKWRGVVVVDPEFGGVYAPPTNNEGIETADGGVYIPPTPAEEMGRAHIAEMYADYDEALNARVEVLHKIAEEEANKRERMNRSIERTRRLRSIEKAAKEVYANHTLNNMVDASYAKVPVSSIEQLGVALGIVIEKDRRVGQRRKGLLAGERRQRAHGGRYFRRWEQRRKKSGRRLTDSTS